MWHGWNGLVNMLLLLLLLMLLLVHEHCCWRGTCRRPTRRRRLGWFGRARKFVPASHVNDDDADDEENNDNDSRQHGAEEEHVRGRGISVGKVVTADPTWTCVVALWWTGSSIFGRRARFWTLQSQFRRYRRFLVLLLDSTERSKECKVNEDVHFSFLSTTARQRHPPDRRSRWYLTWNEKTIVSGLITYS